MAARLESQMTALPASKDLPEFGAHAPGPFIGAILALSRPMPPNWLGRRIGYALRRIAAPGLRGKPFDVEALGARMRLYPYKNVCERRLLFTPRLFDEAELEFLAGRIKPGFTFLDIGANVGGYTMFVAARAGAGARILAFEPQAAIYERLVSNIRLNGFSTVKAMDCAISDRSGEITLFVADHNFGETSIRIMNSEKSGDRVRVPTKSLKAAIEEEGLERIDAIKLDVEGAEEVILDAFFRDAPEAIWPKCLLMETIDGRASPALPKLLADCGYREALRTRRNMAYVRD
jgi:FkbM family methyltransferase